MGYEVWYYVAFGVFRFAPNRWVGIAGAGAALLIAGPHVAVYFPLWLMGVGCFYFCRRLPVRPALGVAVLLGVAAASALVLATAGDAAFRIVMFERPYHLIWQDYGVGALFAASVAGSWLASPVLARILGGAAPVIRGAADLSFTLYLIHLPVLVFFRALSPWPAASFANLTFLLVGLAVSVALAAKVTEHRKAEWRHAIGRLLDRSRTADNALTKTASAMQATDRRP